MPRRLLAVVAPLVLVAAAAGAYVLLTPRDHVAPGCWWWTARMAGEVVPGDHGCLRGYYRGGGAIAEGRAESDFALPIAYTNPDQPGGLPACAFAPGDAVVVRYHAVFDDGRTIAVIEACR